MNAKQLEHLYYDTGDFDEMCAAKAQAVADLEAMRTPITPGALRGAGWGHNLREDAYEYPCDSDSPMWGIQIRFHGTGALRSVTDINTRRSYAGIRNMHDVNELVRLASRPA